MSEPVAEPVSEQVETQEPTQAPVAPSEGPWYSSMDLDEGTIGYVQSKGWENPKVLLESYRHLEQFKGADEKQLIKLPDEMLPENMGPIWEKLGRPTNTDGYEMSLPEGVQVDSARLESFRQWAFENGVSKDAFAKLAALDHEYHASRDQMFEENLAHELRQQEVSLKNEWGAKHDESVFMAQKAIRELGLSEEQVSIIQTGMGHDNMMKMFHKISTALGEKAFAEGEKKTDFGMTREQARYEIELIMEEAGKDRQVWDQINAKSGPKYSRLQQLRAIRAEG